MFVAAESVAKFDVVALRSQHIPQMMARGEHAGIAVRNRSGFKQTRKKLIAP